MQADTNQLTKPLVDVIRGAVGLSAKHPTGEKFDSELKATPFGTPGWVQYQKLCCEIFEYLFCPPLDHPKYENPDASKRNRRDMIFGNPCENGFWANLRQDYSAHYVVMDAKNYGHRIEKKPILEIGHYLKPYGCGLLGIIASRLGVAPSGQHAMREQWISSGKMVVVLSDGDIHEMLRLKATGSHPEEVLRSKIADFRISL